MEHVGSNSDNHGKLQWEEQFSVRDSDRRS
jgi:hypothetical protein